jgi:hypothetical protein
MWIEIKAGENKTLVNLDKIGGVVISNQALFFKQSGIEEDYICIKLTSVEEALAFYEGVVLALNGLDFVSEDNYIKPLLSCKNETLYRYMMMKEFMGDRTKC